MVGGTEKLPAGGLERLGRVPVRSGGDPRDLLDATLTEVEPDAILDLSDEPVLDYRRRFELASLALLRGVPYGGADFMLTPPPRPRLASKPSIAIIGTGKRTGKTAVAAHAARTLAGAGVAPVMVAMGRGGPPEPEILRGDELALTPDDLIELAEAGKHAASDYVEDAFLARVPTVGCRRCGGGLAGAVGSSNVERGVAIANELPGRVMLLEGSGSAIPPVAADATVLVMPASVPPEHVVGYLGVYRVLLADVVVVTMCEEPFGSPSQISSLTALIGDVRQPSGGDPSGKGGSSSMGLQTIRTVLRPSPTEPVYGKKVYIATTAPSAAARTITDHLESAHGCTVAGISHRLSDRKGLGEDLAEIPEDTEILLCEIKAAAVDVVTRHARATGRRVAYLDNVPVGIDGDDLEAAVLSVADVATARFGGR